jgi:hypothetical protein
MSAQFVELQGIVSGSLTLKMEYVCSCVPNMNDAYNNNRSWNIKLSGKGTFENKELIKRSNFTWNKEEQAWYKRIRENHVPPEDKHRQKQEEKTFYNSRGLTYPFCKPKCENEWCNEPRQGNDLICSSCNHKERCKGGLKCDGWMSVPCKYDLLTREGDIMCQKCENDACAWAEKGRQINGPGGWMGNDRS